MSDYSVALVNDSPEENRPEDAPSTSSDALQGERELSKPDADKESTPEANASGESNKASENAESVGVPEQDAEMTPPAEEKEDPEAEIARVRDQLLRMAADFDNYRKRSRKEISDAERQGRSELLRELLPVFDNLERAAAHANSTTEVQALADGIALVMRQFIDTLARIGIARVEAVGVPFDPTVHEAIQHLETTEHAPGTVAAEVQAGYRLGERLIRPSMVVVAKAPAS